MSSKYSYYMTVGRSFEPHGGYELDTFLFVDHEALLREEAVVALEQSEDERPLAKHISQCLSSMKLRSQFNCVMLPMLHVTADAVLTREYFAAWVASSTEEVLRGYVVKS